MMRSIESASSVFYHSQEEDPVRTGGDSQGSYREAPLYDCYQDSMTDSPATTEPDTAGKNLQYRTCIISFVTMMTAGILSLKG